MEEERRRAVLEVACYEVVCVCCRGERGCVVCVKGERGGVRGRCCRCVVWLQSEAFLREWYSRDLFFSLHTIMKE